MGVGCTELQEGGKRPAEASCRRVDLRGGAQQTESGHRSFVREQDRQRWEAGLGCQDREGCGQETV